MDPQSERVDSQGVVCTHLVVVQFEEGVLQQEELGRSFWQRHSLSRATTQCTQVT